jgi:hypothetical protein
MAKYGAGVLNGIADIVLAQSRSVPAWRDTELPDEGTSHVTLVRKTSPLCRFGWSFARGKEATGEANPALNEVGMWRHSYLASKTAQELKAADARQRGQVGKGCWCFRCSVQAVESLGDRRRRTARQMPLQPISTHHVHQATQQALLGREAVGRRMRCAGEQPAHKFPEEGITATGGICVSSGTSPAVSRPTTSGSR